MLAFESADEIRTDLILQKAAPSPELSEGVISALHWLPHDRAAKHIQKLLESKSTDCLYIGIAASALHRRDPKYFLDNAINSSDPRLKARAFHAIGELGRKSHTLQKARLQDNLNNPDPTISFAAAWSSALMGDAKALEILQMFVNQGSPYGASAMNIAMRRMKPGAALAWQKELAKSPDTLRLAVHGAGIIGDPALIPWLLEQMPIPDQARVAGEAFTMITGIDILKRSMEDQCPAGFSAGPNDDPSDPNVGPDPDEFLPWPNREMLAAWWGKHKDKLPAGTRLLLGKTLTRENILNVLNTGSQRQRAAAALELAIIEPGRPLYNICDPAWRQMPRPTPSIRAVSSPPNYGPRELVITAVNCITPVGLDAEMTAASVRAGIDRFTFNDEYRDADGEPLIMAKIRGLRDNERDSIIRIRDLAEICLRDILQEYFQEVPGQKRPDKGCILLGTAVVRRPGPDYGAKCSKTQIHGLRDRVDNPSVKIVPRGNASLHYALLEAYQIISGDPNALCIVSGVDTHLIKHTLDWLKGGSRLKSSCYGKHNGLHASEAVSHLVVEDREHAIRARRRILARISSIGLAQEQQPRASDKTGIGAGLSEACQVALESLKGKMPEVIFADLNGEDSRARELIMAIMRSFKKDQEKPPIWKPAECYGDIGAASGAVMASIVAWGFTRNWIPSPAMIVCSDDYGPCGALILEKETETERKLQ